MQIPAFAKARVLVAGDVMLDRYWHGPTGRISPEAPVPVVRVTELEDRPGGAANVALNMAALGARAELVGIYSALLVIEMLVTLEKANGAKGKLSMTLWTDSQASITAINNMTGITP
ncbi:MAG: hypothetical protein ACPHM2_06115, partial [Alcanivorax sp.]